MHQCEWCAFVTHDRAELAQHQRDQHNFGLWKMKCFYCDFTSSRMEDFEVHMKEKHKPASISIEPIPPGDWSFNERELFTTPALPHAHALYEEAERLISGPRPAAYGPYNPEARAIAALWTALLRDVLREGVTLPARKVPLLMMALKLNRMAVKPHHDSLVDVCGYAGLMVELEAAEGATSTKQENAS